jgi:hypothetical protein
MAPLGVSQESITSIIRVTRNGELGRKLAVTNNYLRSVLQLLITAKAVLSSLIISTLMIEAMRSFETSVITRLTLHHIQEDGLLRIR